MIRFSTIILLLILLTACSQPAVAPPTIASSSETAVSSAPQPITLPPTFTPIPANTQHPTPHTPLPTTAATPTPTPIAFAQTVVELRLAIPAIGLDRRLEGKLGGTVIVADEATGLILQRSGEGHVVADLRQVLPTLALAPLPEGCEACVAFSYSLPEEGRSGSGWLQDVQLLASVERYFSGVLGPHFPPGTVAGLHRAPSPYAPGHTVAVDENGRLWAYLATDNQIPPPTTADSSLLAAAERLQNTELAPVYEVACAGGLAPETLWLYDRAIQLLCPEFALPNTLQTLYLALDTAIAPRLAGLDGPERPPARLSLAALLDYRRADGVNLTLFADGGVVVEAASVITATLPISQTMGLVNSLLVSGELQPGLTSFGDAAPGQHQLLVRGADGVVDGSWPGKTAVSLLTELDALLQQWLPATPIPPTTTPDNPATPTPTVP
ncbi:MAG: hypothetical protein R3C62_13605 [Chloroflexota bacterium]